jgi:deoxyribonuclease V
VLHVRNELPVPGTDEERHAEEVRLAREVKPGPQFKNVAGVNVHPTKDFKRGYAVASVLSTTNWRPVAEQKAMGELSVPFDRDNFGWAYGALMVEVLAKLPVVPDLILVTGNGIAHPRKFGAACHVGYVFDHPTIGVSGLWPNGCKDIAAMARERRGTKTALIHEVSGARVGYQVFTQETERPVFVSPGHRISVDDAANFALRCAPWRRMPQPIWEAVEASEQFHNENES